MGSDEALYSLPNGVETRWLNPENVTGDRGAGGRSNFGRKGAPCRGMLKAGETWVLGEGEGMGTIRRFWITVSEWRPEILRGTVIRIYWDGEDKPAVEAPIADFFGNLHGRRYVVTSEWFNNPEGRNWNMMVPMPFRRSFRITVTNDSPLDIRMFWYHIDYTVGESHDESTGYFHACWHRENPTTLRRDFTILPRVTGRGRYLGCTMGLITRPYYRSWWGEGEVKIYLDGDDAYPTLCGTGTEDYICSAWGIGSFSLPWYGCHFLPVADADRQEIGMYRLHGPDPVWFHREIRIEMQQIGYWGGEATMQQLEETGQSNLMLAGDGKEAIPLTRLKEEKTPISLYEREDDWCATAYFYLDKPASEVPSIAAYEARVADLPGEPPTPSAVVPQPPVG